jgi:hypothetical protein
MFGIVFAILFVTGCGGGGGTKKDAAYYKERFRKNTTIKALHTDKRVLFTIKSLEDAFVSKFDINGTNEGVNRDIIVQLKSNLADAVDNVDASELKDNVAIILPGVKDENKTQTMRLDTQLQEAIKQVCSGCEEDDIKGWFVEHQAALEKSAQDGSGIDEADDNQPLFAPPPPPEPLLILGAPPPYPPEIVSGYADYGTEKYDFVEIQKLREQYNRGVDKYKK